MNYRPLIGSDAGATSDSEMVSEELLLSLSLRRSGELHPSPFLLRMRTSPLILGLGGRVESSPCGDVSPSGLKCA